MSAYVLRRHREETYASKSARRATARLVKALGPALVHERKWRPSQEKALEPTRLQATTLRYPARRSLNLTPFSAFGQDFAQFNLRHLPRHRPNTHILSVGAVVFTRPKLSRGIKESDPQGARVPSLGL